MSLTPQAIDAAIRSAQAAARQRHALWDADDFEALCAQARPSLEMLDSTSLDAWLRVAAEPCASRTLRACLIEAGPLLAPIAAPARLNTLADLFNLCEGLCSAEPWFDPYVASRLDGLGDLSDLPTLVELALDDVLSPLPVDGGALQQIMLDPRPIDPQFVPGQMWLAAPRVVCVADRRRDARLGVALGTDQVTLFGPIPALDRVEPPAPLITIIDDYRAKWGEQHLGFHAQYPLHSTLAFANVVCLTADDSQRVWVVRPEAA